MATQKHNPPLVLVADDQTSTTTMLERIFALEGYQVSSVYNGTDALETARRLLPDLILLDIMMPGMTGFEVLSALRENAATAGIPTILITAMGEPADVARGLRLGADDYITKPFHPRELLARAQSKMKARQLEEDLQRRTQELEALLRVSEELNQHLEMDELLDLLLYLILDLLPGDVAAIYHLSEHQTIAAQAAKNKDGTPYTPSDLNHEWLVEQLLKLDEAVMWPEAAPVLENFEHGMAIPLSHWNDVIGFLILAGGQPYDSNHLRLFKGIGRQATLALRNADLYQIQADYALHLEDMVAERTAELQSAQQLLIRSEKLASIGRLSASIAHEINNPLLPIQLNLEGMLEDIGDGIAVDAEAVEKSLDSVERIRSIVNRLLSFTRAPSDDSSDSDTVDVNDIVENIISLNRKYFEKEKVAIQTDLVALPHIYGSRYQLEQVFMNLALNATAAMTGGGTLAIKTWPENEQVVIQFIDTGIGIPADMLDKIFEPFVSTKEEGTGLGLFISYGIIQNHQGIIEVQSEPGQGATFTVRLPAMQEPPLPDEETPE